MAKQPKSLMAGFPCGKCPKAFLNILHLENHVLQTSKDKIHSEKRHEEEEMHEVQMCNVCKIEFESIKKLYFHRSKNPQCCFIQCEICNKSFSNRTSIANHIALHYRPKLKPVVRVRQRVQLNCTICGIPQTELKNHMRGHTREKDFRCDKCSFATHTPPLLTHHMKALHGDQLFQCLKCNVKKSSITNLKNHTEKVHDSVRYQCDICAQNFTKTSNLYQHKRRTHKLTDFKVPPKLKQYSIVDKSEMLQLYDLNEITVKKVIDKETLNYIQEPSNIHETMTLTNNFIPQDIIQLEEYLFDVGKDGLKITKDLPITDETTKSRCTIVSNINESGYFQSQEIYTENEVNVKLGQHSINYIHPFEPDFIILTFYALAFVIILQKEVYPLYIRKKDTKIQDGVKTHEERDTYSEILIPVKSELQLNVEDFCVIPTRISEPLNHQCQKHSEQAKPILKEATTKILKSISKGVSFKIIPPIKVQNNQAQKKEDVPSKRSHNIRTNHICHKCSKNIFGADNLKRHIAFKHEGLRFRCSQCTFNCTDNRVLQKHFSKFYHN